MSQLTVWGFQLYHDQQCEEMPHGKKTFAWKIATTRLRKLLFSMTIQQAINIGETTMIHVL